METQKRNAIEIIGSENITCIQQQANKKGNVILK